MKSVMRADQHSPTSPSSLTRRRVPTVSGPVLFNRQRELLALLFALGGKVSGEDFRDLLFLYCQQTEGVPPYEFVPTEHGASSFTSIADRIKLVERDFLTDDEEHWGLTPAGKLAAADLEDSRIAAFARALRGVRGDALVAETYRRFPYYATRSAVVRRRLQGKRAVLAGIEAARTLSQGPSISTIGYEGRTLEGYLNDLLRAGVSLLCDVRRNPLSRKYGFSKRTLASGCGSVGIRYEHMPELGIASDERRDLETQADYDALFAKYVKRYLPSQGSALARIGAWVRDGERVALTCYERAPTQCHRGCVSNALRSQFGKSFDAKHL